MPIKPGSPGEYTLCQYTLCHMSFNLQNDKIFFLSFLTLWNSVFCWCRKWSSASNGVAASGTQTCLLSKSRFPQVQPKALIRSLTCLADGTALDKQEWMKWGPKQLAQAEEAVGIPDVQKQFWSPGLRRVNSGSTRKLVMLRLSVYFGPCASWEGKSAKKCEAEEKAWPQQESLQVDRLYGKWSLPGTSRVGVVEQGRLWPPHTQ